MPSLISHIVDRQQLLDDLNYLNMDEIKSVCDRSGIPYRIWILTSDGRRRRTNELDRKGIILDRLRRYLVTGIVSDPTFFPAKVVSSEAAKVNIKATDRLRYGQYDKKSATMMALLQSLTDGQFKDGAIARILINEFWRNGKAPTYQQYAKKWLQVQTERSQPNPEWAFLSDLSAGKDVTDWKQQRVKKARRVLKVLKSLQQRAYQAVAADCPKPRSG